MSRDLIVFTLVLMGICVVTAAWAAGVWWLGEWAKRAILRRIWRKHWGCDE
jgi:hypothetical protein